MHSLRTRFTLLNVCLIVIAVTIVTLLSVLFIRSNERRESDQLLLLLCETGEHNLDYYFNGVQKSVAKVANFTEEDLEGLSDRQLNEHVERVREYFDEMANKTSGVLTYYYRIDPEVSDTVKGFWYTNLDGNEFTEHAVTDITLYDTEDTSDLVWFTVPKTKSSPVWLPPYITENLGARVISYNVPIFHKGTFVGVVGIEIDYSTMAEQVESIRLYNNGYAFLSDAQGNLFYHPRIDVAQLSPEEMPDVPEGLVTDSTFTQYVFDGVEKHGAWLGLSNGMRLYVTVPVAETDGNWKTLIRMIVLASAIVIVLLSLFTMYYTGRVTKPLVRLIKAAEEVDHGNYNFELDYSRDDEVGRLTKTFKRLSAHMKDNISDLNKRVYVDALTSVKNKGAFVAELDDMQTQLELPGEKIEYAIGVFDCDDLKKINDRYGHEKGDIYLKTASRLICRVFQHSPVYRIGGDEFAVILCGDDYKNREELIGLFEEKREEISALTENKWEQVFVAMGVATYDPNLDHAVIDTVRRADKTMYENKRIGKAARQEKNTGMSDDEADTGL